MKSKVTDIIINFPTNLGDTILALPTLDRIKSNYPNSNITAIASKRTQSLLDSNTFIDKVIVFDKTWGIKEKGDFTCSLRSRYQLMVDLKHTLLPMLLKIRHRTPYIRKFSKTEHITDKYLKLIQKLAPKPACEKSQFNIPKDKRSEYAKRIFTWSRDYTAVAKAHLKKKSRKGAITCKDLRTLVPGKTMLVAKLQGWLQHDQKPEWLKEKA